MMGKKIRPDKPNAGLYNIRLEKVATVDLMYIFQCSVLCVVYRTYHTLLFSTGPSKPSFKAKVTLRTRRQ